MNRKARTWHRIPLVRGLRRPHSELGQSLVEFTLILPVFLILLFGLVDFGRAFYTWQIVTNASREGARAAAIQSDAATIIAKTRGSFCNPYPSSCALDTSLMTITPTNVQGSRGDNTSVQVNYRFSYVTPISPLLNLFFGSSITAPTISSTTTMRLE